MKHWAAGMTSRRVNGSRRCICPHCAYYAEIHAGNEPREENAIIRGRLRRHIMACHPEQGKPKAGDAAKLLRGRPLPSE